VGASPLIVETEGNLGKQCDVKVNGIVSIGEVMNLLPTWDCLANFKDLQYRRF